MRTFHFITVLSLLMVLVSGCGDHRITDPTNEAVVGNPAVSAQEAAAELMTLAGWPDADATSMPNDEGRSPQLVDDFTRQEVAPGIAFYSCTVQMGADPRDEIGLYRVVKEGEPWRPLHTAKAIFLQHGDAKDFTGMFLPGLYSATLPDDSGAAVYWARADVDVWGIDQAWNLVPAGTTEFAFMADWGIDKQSRDLGTAIAIAREVRSRTSNVNHPMILLGYSSGSTTGYALLNAETQLPPAERQVGAWIPVDNSPISDVLEWNQVQNCDWLAGYQQMIDDGEYGYFVGFDYLGNLARDDPDGESPVFPGFTNLQAAMYMGGGPIFNYGGIHYLAANWQDDLPVDFRYVPVEQCLDFMIAGAPWEPTQFILDYAT